MRGGCGLDCRDVLYLERGRQVQAMEHRKSPWINFLFFMADACMTMLAALLSIFLRQIIPWGGEAILPAEHYVPFLLLFIPVLLLTMLFAGQYRYNRGVSILLEFMSIVRLVFLAVVAMLALSFFYREYQFSRLHIVYFFTLAVVLIFTGRVVIRLWLRRVRSSGRNLMHIVVLGEGRRLESFVREMRSVAGYGYSVDGVFSLTTGRTGSGLPYSKKALQVWLEQHRMDEAYILLGSGDRHEKRMREALELFEREGVRTRLVPDLDSSLATGARMALIGNIPVLTIAEYPLDFWYNRAIKRAFDILVSLTGLVFSSPLFLLIALAVRLSSPGPVFFRQERLGLDRRKFTIIKFRTMYRQEKQTSDTVWTVKNDPRVTHLGRLLRVSSLDELPQLVNVLKGEMTLVGPRPERQHFVNEFKKRMPLYMERHRVKAGLTGWAQVSGYRGDSSIERRLQADLYYIRNWSFTFDIRIMLLTLVRVLSGRNAH